MSGVPTSVSTALALPLAHPADQHTITTDTVDYRSIETRSHGLASVFLNRAPSRAGQPAFFYWTFYFWRAKILLKNSLRALRARQVWSVSGRSQVGRSFIGQLWARPVVAAAQPRAGVRGATSGKAGLGGGREEGEGVSEGGR